LSISPVVRWKSLRLLLLVLRFYLSACTGSTTGSTGSSSAIRPGHCLLINCPFLGVDMGSIRKDKWGHQYHWTDRLKECNIPKLSKPQRQKKSLSGQQSLFGGDDIKHLEPDVKNQKKDESDI